MSEDTSQKKTFYYTFVWGSDIPEHEEEEPAESVEKAVGREQHVIEAESVPEAGVEAEAEAENKVETSTEDGGKEEVEKEPIREEGEEEGSKKPEGESSVEPEVEEATDAENEVQNTEPEQSAATEAEAEIEIEEMEAQKIPKQVIVTGTFDDWNCTHAMKLDPSNSVFRLIVPLELDPSDKQGRVHFKFVVDGEWTVNESYPMDVDDKGNQNNYLSVGYVERHSMQQKFRRIKKYKKNKQTGERILIQEKVVEVDPADNVIRVVESTNYRLVPTNENKEVHTTTINSKLYEITENDFSSSFDENDDFNGENAGVLLNNDKTDEEASMEGTELAEPTENSSEKAASGIEDNKKVEAEKETVGNAESKGPTDSKSSANENKPNRQTVSAPAATGTSKNQAEEKPKKRGLMGKLHNFFY